MQYIVILVMITTTTLFVHSARQYAGDDDYPICVVGAGLSGLIVGRELYKKGYPNVLIFEKSHKVGGKLDTYRQGNDIQVEVGAVLHCNVYYSFLEYMRKFNLTSVPFDAVDLIGFDPHSGTFRAPSYDLTELGRLGNAFLRYSFHRGMYARDLEYGYENVSPDLFVSFSDWLEKRHLGALKAVFRILITHMGYGDLDDIPALYGSCQYIDENKLRSMLPKNGETLEESDLVTWSIQIARGMEYLSLKHVVHGDLAARNILLTNDRIAKITDFGLSVQLYKDTLYRRKEQILIPWKWMSIESLTDNEFSSEADVWSYGITLWEIFSLGQTPYPGTECDSKFIQNLMRGKRLHRPDYASDKIHKIMLRAWHAEPNSRPACREIIELIHLATMEE